jgi:hypothetical protein
VRRGRSSSFARVEAETAGDVSSSVDLDALLRCRTSDIVLMIRKQEAIQSSPRLSLGRMRGNRENRIDDEMVWNYLGYLG